MCIRDRFYTNSERLTPLGQRTLNQVAEVLAKYRGMPVEIAGHTDSQGDAASNMELSRKRAAAVKQYLIDKGIAGSTLTDAGFGDTKPIASNADVYKRQVQNAVPSAQGVGNDDGDEHKKDAADGCIETVVENLGLRSGSDFCRFQQTSVR